MADPPVGPGITAGSLFTFAVSKGSAVYSGYHLARGNKQRAAIGSGIGLLAETNWLHELPSLGGILLDAALTAAVYYAMKPAETDLAETLPGLA